MQLGLDSKLLRRPRTDTVSSDIWEAARPLPDRERMLLQDVRSLRPRLRPRQL
jgi:hypothetical protein